MSEASGVSVTIAWQEAAQRNVWLLRIPVVSGAVSGSPGQEQMYVEAVLLSDVAVALHEELHDAMGLDG